ncbi:TetR/AcrR family transcriptional regulator [Nocardioides sp. SYSU D00038]|uniref:TetR/AcrR family transcriptional regulator n=1 Tax=Nocardioides sp. SYSU D00038 TaxID=2812554 RepID=UPI001966FF3D|nr:TetR/AcrR family transcriptional regulator [Nocardioides sp. SYSU D00038]
MTPATTRDTRQRMVAGAARMIATSGVEAMSLRDLAEREGVPLGSTYHYFPGGKKQLVDEAVRYAGQTVLRLIVDSRTQSTRSVLRVLADGWRGVLERSDYRTGCTVAAAATSTEDQHQEVAREVFEEWHRALSTTLVETGVPERVAPGVARTVVASTEGALLLARATRSVGPLDEVVAVLTDVVEAARRLPR